MIFEAEGENGAESVFEVQYSDVEGAGLVVCNVVKECSCWFSGPRNYTGTLFTWF
jgi:hypothetical protein